MDLSGMSTRFDVNGDVVLQSNVFLLQVLCPPCPCCQKFGGHVPPWALCRRRLWKPPPYFEIYCRTTLL